MSKKISIRAQERELSIAKYAYIPVVGDQRIVLRSFIYFKLLKFMNYSYTSFRVTFLGV